MVKTKYRILNGILWVLMCIQVTLASAQTNTKADEKILAYLKQFRLAFIKSVLDKKSELLTGYYDDNVRLMVEFQKTMIGKENVLAYHQAFLSRLDSKSYTREELEILDLGAMVVEYGFFNLKATLKSSGKEYEIQGKYQNIWKKEKDKLLLITEGWNYNQRLDIGDQLRFSEVPVIDVALLAHSPIKNNISFELAALNRLVEATVSEHDANIWSQFYSDDAIIFAQYRSVQRGRKEIDEYYRQHVKELPVFEKLDVRNDRIDDLGNYVIEYASHIAIIRDGDFSGVFTGKDLAIWRREPNGSLKIFRHMAMYD
jgi:ketosteroid isomerase-like protein